MRLTALLANTDDAARVQWSEVGRQNVEFRRTPDGSRLAVAPWGGGDLHLFVRGNIVEWKLQVSPSAPAPILGEHGAVRDTFLAAMRRWVGNAALLRRLAYGSVALSEVETEVHGVAALAAGGLRSLRLDGDAHDLMFRINRRRPSAAVPEVYLNRVGTWSVIWVGADWRDTGPIAPADGELHWYCRVETDVNTPREFVGTLPGAKVSPLVDELVAAADQILSAGEP